MKIKKPYLFILYFVPTLLFGAKPPGYLGKKTLIGAYYCYMPDYYSPSNETPRDFEFNQRSRLAPTFLTNFQVSRVISGKVDLSLQVGYHRYGLIGFDPSTMYNQLLSNGNLSAYSRTSGMTYKLIARVSTDYKSPLGRYFGLGLGRNLQKLEKVDQFGNFEKISKESDIGICYEVGTRRHVGYNLLLDIGLEGTFYFAAHDENNNTNIRQSDFIYQSITINKSIYGRRNLAYFKLGLNYIF